MEKIQNIYAFCDRWCERCPFGSQCEAFAADPAVRKPENMVADDEINRLFWENILSQLPQTLQYVQHRAKEKNAALDDFPGISTRAKFDLFQRKAVNNMVLKAGRKYEDLVDDFLDEQAEAGTLAMNELQPGSVFKIQGGRFSETEIERGNDLLAVIMRYQLQLYLKLSRAYYAKGREAEEAAVSDDGALPSDGTAKVCITLINRSLVAWHGLLHFFPEQTGQVDEILFLLMRIRYRLQQEFPNAQTFVRPGFDT